MNLTKQLIQKKRERETNCCPQARNVITENVNPTVGRKVGDEGITKTIEF